MKKITALILTLLAALVLANPAYAVNTGYYLIEPYDNEGRTTIDFKFWSRKNPGMPIVNAPDIGVGYGVTSRWYTELYAAYINVASQPVIKKDITWQNDVLLTQGQYPVDLALHTSVIDYQSSARGTGFEFGPILQTDFGRTNVNVGLLFERDYRGAPSNKMQLKYQWQVKQRWTHALNFGVQGFGEVGEWRHWAPRAQQSHRAGPALSGTVDLTEKQSLIWDLSYLIGSYSTVHGKAWNLRLQFAF